MSTHYEVLGLPATAGRQEIRTAYRQLAKRTHPDAPGGDTSRFRALTQAYETLYSDEARRLYDTRIVPRASRAQGGQLQLWLNIAASGLFALAAAVCWVEGDRAGDYRPWLVGVGWAAAILAWRTFEERGLAFRNPLLSLADGAVIIAQTTARLALRLGVLMMLLIGGVELLGLVERLVGA